MMEPLVIKKRDSVKGLYVFCKKCKKTIDNKKCGKTGKTLRTCKDTHQHCFRAVVAVPNTNGAKRKTRVFNTRNLEEAVRLKFDFENELVQTDYQLTTNHQMKDVVKPEFIVECMAMYVGYMNNVDVPAHKVKVRTEKHIGDVERYFKYFLLALKAKGIDHTIFRVNQLNDEVVAIYHSYLLIDLNYRNKTYNKAISQFRHFINWLINDHGYELKNPFIGVTRRYTTTNNVVVTKKEFDALLEKVVPENGIQHFKNGLKRNFYRPWMTQAFRLALETGLRREEFMAMKFSNIIEDEEGSLSHVKVENYKVNRLLGKSGEERQYKSVPITNGFKALLDELDYKNNKGKERYLIGPDEKSSRETLKLYVSKSFSHFWSFTGNKKEVYLKNLRKTYLTALVQHFGDKATMISDHSGVEVLKKHYVNSQQLAAASRDLKIL